MLHECFYFNLCASASVFKMRAEKFVEMVERVKRGESPLDLCIEYDLTLWAFVQRRRCFEKGREFDRGIDMKIKKPPKEPRVKPNYVCKCGNEYYSELPIFTARCDKCNQPEPYKKPIVHS